MNGEASFMVIGSVVSVTNTYMKANREPMAILKIRICDETKKYVNILYFGKYLKSIKDISKNDYVIVRGYITDIKDGMYQYSRISLVAKETIAIPQSTMDVDIEHMATMAGY